MRKNLFKIVSLIYLFLFILPDPVSAHLYGQPPFFKINGGYSNFYPVPVSSLADFDLPQDLAPDNYLVNQKLLFEFDESRLPAPPAIIEKTKFTWDFGDGTTATGLRNYHTYTKMGSYIIRINADDGTTPTAQLLETVLLNILPDQSYHLPQSIISVNGVQSKDPLTDILHLDFANSLNFDSSLSKSSSDITSYFWDFGDQKFDTKPKLNHQYSSNTNQVFVLLRIKTSDGFIADSFLEIQNQPGAVSAATPIAAPAIKNKQSKNNPFIPYVLLGTVVLIIVLFMARQLPRDPGRGKH